MKYVFLPSILLLSAALSGCGSSSGERPELDSARPLVIGASSSRQSISTSSSVSSEVVLQEALKAQVEAALASEDPQEFLALFYLEDIESERVDELQTVVIDPLYDEEVDDITFEAPDDNYESFDVDYRYTPNLEVVGEITLHFADPNPAVNTSVTMFYGLVEGSYVLGHAKRELMQYAGPRNRQLSYSIVGQTSPTLNQFHVTASYQVSGLIRSIDAVQDAGYFSTFPGQYILDISIDQIVGTADFYVQIFEGGELIYTTQTENKGGTIRYVRKGN